MSWPFAESLTSLESPQQLRSDNSDPYLTRSCHSRSHSGEHSVCKKYKEVRFRCNHKTPTNAEGLQWWESWDVCHDCRSDKTPARAELHWRQRPNQKDDYEPGLKMLHYSCFDCWKNLIVPSQFKVFQTEWEPQLCKSDWENVLECARFHLAKIHPTQQTGRWCCTNDADEEHNPFSCKMACILQEGAKRKMAVEQGWSGLDSKPLWVRPEPHVPIGTGGHLIL